MVTSKVKKGDKIAARVHHNGVKAGTEGKVVGVYNGTYYAVSYPGIQGVCYTPDPHMVAVSGPAAGPTSSPAPGGTGTPGVVPAQPSKAEQEVADHAEAVRGWERLAGMFVKVQPVA